MKSSALATGRICRSNVLKTPLRKPYPSAFPPAEYVNKGMLLIFDDGTGQCNAKSRKISPASSGSSELNPTMIGLGKKVQHKRAVFRCTCQYTDAVFSRLHITKLLSTGTSFYHAFDNKEQ